MNKKAFLLVDSLVCLIITVCISALSIYTFNQVDYYHENYKLYYEEINDRYSDIFHVLSECEKCEIEEDSDIEIESDIDEDL